MIVSIGKWGWPLTQTQQLLSHRHLSFYSRSACKTLRPHSPLSAHRSSQAQGKISGTCSCLLVQKDGGYFQLLCGVLRRVTQSESPSVCRSLPGRCLWSWPSPGWLRGSSSWKISGTPTLASPRSRASTSPRMRGSVWWTSLSLWTQHLTLYPR